MTFVPPKRNPPPEQDPPPYPVLFSTYRGVVARALRSLGVASRRVEDATQEVFLIVLLKLPEYEPRGNVLAWIFGITRNVAAVHRRRENQSPLAPADVPVADPDARGEDSAAAYDLLARLLTVIENDDHRRAFILYHLERWTMQEIAHLFGERPTTIKSWIFRAQRDVEAAARRMRAHDCHATGPAVVPLFGAAALFETLRAVPSLPDAVFDRIGARLMQAPELRARHVEDGGAPVRRKAIPRWAAAPLLAIGLTVGMVWAPLREPPRAPLVVKADSDMTAPPALVLPPPGPAPAPLVSSRVGLPEGAPAIPRAESDREPELALMHDAEAAIAAGDVATALAKLDMHAERFGPRNASWREVTRIEALVHAGRIEEARGVIERFARGRPGDKRLGVWRKAVGIDPAP